MNSIRKYVLENSILGNESYLYHGTDKKIDDLKPNKHLRGLYTSTDPRVADDYGRYVYTLEPNAKAKLLDLSDGEDLLQYMLKNRIVTERELEDEPDLEAKISGGRSFERDPFHRNLSLIDHVVNQANHQGYDIVAISDNLGGLGGNIAYIVTKMDNITLISGPTNDN
jgi:hypothetical protein